MICLPSFETALYFFVVIDGDDVFYCCFLPNSYLVLRDFLYLIMQLQSECYSSPLQSNLLLAILYQNYSVSA